MTKFLVSLAAAFVCLLIPDVFVTYFVANEENPYRWYLHSESIVFLALILSALLVTESMALRLGLLGVLTFFQTTQLVHFAYYGTFYSQYSIGYMFSELHDFATGIQALFGLIWPTLLASTVAAALTFAVLIWHRKRVTHRLSNIPAFLLIILLVFPFFKALMDDNDYKPSGKQLAIRCGLYSWNGFFAMGFKVREAKDYEPYQLAESSSKINNIVLIIGESAGYTRMSLFGAERNTTPFLKSMANDPNFHYQLALSSSVATQYSMGYFLNGVYEPDNAVQMGSKGANIFRIAENNGYDMHFVSNHTIGSQSQIYRYGNFKTWIDKSMPASTWGQYDKGMIDAYFANQKEPSEKQFIVLHTYNMHTPYTDNYPESFQKFPPAGEGARAELKGNYDNSLLYLDHTIEHWVSRLKTHLKGPTLVVYVPDHGEKFQPETAGDGHDHSDHEGHDHDEDHKEHTHKHEGYHEGGGHSHAGGGWHGHGFLDVGVATVPVFALGLNGADEALAEFKSKLGCLTSHYKIHNALASLMGTEVINPNAQSEKFYISGLSYYGAAGWIEGRFDEYESLCNIGNPKRQASASENLGPVSSYN